MYRCFINAGTAAPRPAVTGPPSPARKAVGTDGFWGHRGAKTVPGGRHSPPVVPAAVESELGCGRTEKQPPPGRSPETELGGGHRWLLPEGSLRTSSCLLALGAFCTRCVQWFRPVWQPKLARGWGSAVPVAALGWTLSVPLSHPSAGRPHLLLSCVGWSRGAAVLSRGSPRSPTPRQPGQTQSHTTRLLWPWEHWSSCWHSVWGKRRPHFRR